MVTIPTFTRQCVPGIAHRLRPGSDFTGRCRGFGSVTDPQRWSWEAVVKVLYTVTKGRCRAANIRRSARNVIPRDPAEPEALTARRSFRITSMDSKLFLGLCSRLPFVDVDASGKCHCNFYSWARFPTFLSSVFFFTFYACVEGCNLAWGSVSVHENLRKR